MLRHILDKPGVNKSQMCIRFDIAWGTCTYHVEVLERTRRIRRVALGRQVHLFGASIDYVSAQRRSALLQPHARDVVLALGADRQSCVKDIMDRSHLSRRLVTNRLRELQKAGLVECYGDGRKRYRASPLACRLAQEIP